MLRSFGHPTKLLTKPRPMFKDLQFIMQTPIIELNVNTLVSVLIALQFAVFGWRINREIPVGDAGRRTWFPVPDIINILSMFSIVCYCVILPLVSGQFSKESRVALAVAYVLIAFHPVCMIGHYNLFSSQGRYVYLVAGKDFPYCTGLESVFILIATSLATAVGVFAWHY